MDSYDIFQHAKPMKGAIVRDWTKGTLVVDVKNANGESFHFEVDSTKQDKTIVLPPKWGDTGLGGKFQMEFCFTIPVSE